jgi:hypothetical protein
MLANTAELAAVLAEGDRLGSVFARHAYGMRRWVDHFSARVLGIEDPHAKALIAALVADNARHMNLFRERALAHGVDPDAYRAPPEGEAIYERLDELEAFDEVVAFALGSLDHFAQLLEVYSDSAHHADLAVIAAVRADVDRMRGQLRSTAAGDDHTAADEAHALYRRRELVETPRYALAG